MVVKLTMTKLIDLLVFRDLEISYSSGIKATDPSLTRGRVGECLVMVRKMDKDFRAQNGLPVQCSTRLPPAITNDLEINNCMNEHVACVSSRKLLCQPISLSL